jgi:hypothetical protein
MLLNLNLGSNQVKVQIVTVLVARILEHRRINRISKSEKANQVSIRPGIDRAFTFCTWKRSIVTSQRTRNPKISFTHFFHPHKDTGSSRSCTYRMRIRCVSFVEAL